MLTGEIPLTGAPYQNPSEPLDVNADAAIEALDSLLVANSLMAHFGQPFPAAELAGLSPIEYQDVNGDDWIDGVDFSLIADWLNGNNGDPPPPPPPAPPSLTVSGPSDIEEKSLITLSGTAANVSMLWVEIDCSNSFAFANIPQLNPDGTWTWTNYVLDDTCHQVGTPDDLVTITFVALGQDATEVRVSHPLTVRNVDPTIVSVTLSDTEINEGDTVDLQVIFHDKINPAYFTAESETFDLTVNWGDGTAAETYNYLTLTPLSATNLATGTPADYLTYVTTVSHTFLDDNPSNSSQDNYTIVATIADDDSGTATEPTLLTVKNVDPVATITSIEIIDAQIGVDPVSGEPFFLNPGQLDESEGFLVRGTISDAGRNDTFTSAKFQVDLNWDGDILDDDENVDLPLIGEDGFWTFVYTVTKVKDDGDSTGRNGNSSSGNGTTEDDLIFIISVTDDDLGPAMLPNQIAVHNDIPAMAMTSLSHVEACMCDAKYRVIEGETFTLEVFVSDLGELDGNVMNVNWGDTSATETYSLELTRQVVLSHVYVDDDPTSTGVDIYTVTIGVIDDDTGSSTRSFDIEVSNDAPSLSDRNLTFMPDLNGDISSVTISGSIRDSGADDSHTITVDVIGSSSQSQETTNSSFSLTIQFPTPVSVDALDQSTLLVTDDDGGQAKYFLSSGSSSEDGVGQGKVVVRSTAETKNGVIVAGWLGRNTEAGVEAAGVHQMLTPAADLNEFDVLEFAWDADYDAKLKQLLDEHTKQLAGKCPAPPNSQIEMEVILVGHSYGGHSAIKKADWFDAEIKKRNLIPVIHLITVDPIDHEKTRIRPVPADTGPSASLKTFEHHYQHYDVTNNRTTNGILTHGDPITKKSIPTSETKEDDALAVWFPNNSSHQTGHKGIDNMLSDSIGDTIKNLAEQAVK